MQFHLIWWWFANFGAHNYRWLVLWHSWRSPNPITERPQLRNTVQVTPIPIVRNPGGTSVPVVKPSNSLPEAMSAPTPFIDTPSDNNPRMQPFSPTAPGYEHYFGTRLSTVLLIRRDGSVIFIERDIWRLGKDGKPERLDYKERQKEGDTRQRVFEFKLDLNLGTWLSDDKFLLPLAGLSRDMFVPFPCLKHNWGQQALSRAPHRRWV